MSNDYIASLTENASRLGNRLQESLSEHTRELGFGRGTSAMYLESSDDRTKDLRRQLDSNSDREKLDAMKRLIALISKGRNVSEYFAQVVKNVASQNLEIRKLVYIYVLRYAEQEPDLALLSINTFQRDLTDSNPLIRAMALRVLSGIKVPMIINIVVLGIKKCAVDLSPYVRKVAALALFKCYHLDSSQLPTLIEIISNLLRDHSPSSIGSVAAAFDVVCPTRLDLIHPEFRRLCRLLVDADEWGQVNLLNLLLRYTRTMLARPSEEEDLDRDIKLLLTSSSPLLQSRNPAVVLSVARTFYYVAPRSYHARIVLPLLRLLSGSRVVERVVLTYVHMICRASPSLFAPFYMRFLLRTDDSRPVKQDKLRILSNLLCRDNHQAILIELIEYADDPDDMVLLDTIQCIGRCARVVPECTQQCITSLISMIKGGHDAVVASAIMVLKRLVQEQMMSSAPVVLNRGSTTPVAIISHLAQHLEDIRHSHARACVLWLVGQHAVSPNVNTGLEELSTWVPDVLRKVSKTFREESDIVKLQVLTLAAKVLVLSPNVTKLTQLGRYVFSLARYDTNTDVRDRGRMLTALLAGLSDEMESLGLAPLRGGVVLRQEQVKLVLFDGKGTIFDEEMLSGGGQDRIVLGSLEAITGKFMQSDQALPAWLEMGVVSSLRDTGEDPPRPAPEINMPQSRMAMPVILSPTEGSSQAASKWSNLDSFYDDQEVLEEDEATDTSTTDEGESSEESENVDERDEDSEESDEVTGENATLIHD